MRFVNLGVFVSLSLLFSSLRPLRFSFAPFAVNIFFFTYIAFFLLVFVAIVSYKLIGEFSIFRIQVLQP
jgi:hypothetical protein